jgi:hypothetical protein
MAIDIPRCHATRTGGNTVGMGYRPRATLGHGLAIFYETF